MLKWNSIPSRFNSDEWDNAGRSVGRARRLIDENSRWNNDFLGSGAERMVVADSRGKTVILITEWPILREDIPSSCEGRKERGHYRVGTYVRWS